MVAHQLIQAYGVLKALQQIHEYSVNEISNQPSAETYILHTESIVAGAFSILTNMITLPNTSCVGCTQAQALTKTERENIELRWQKQRKDAKQEYQRRLQVFEEETAQAKKDNVSAVQHSTIMFHSKMQYRPLK